MIGYYIDAKAAAQELVGALEDRDHAGLPECSGYRHLVGGATVPLGDLSQCSALPQPSLLDWAVGTLLQRHRFDVDGQAPVLPRALLTMFPSRETIFNLQPG